MLAAPAAPRPPRISRSAAPPAPGGALHAAVTHDPDDPALDHAWTRIDAELRAGRPTPTSTTSGSRRCARSRSPTALVEVAAPPELRAWVADRFARVLRRERRRRARPTARACVVRAGEAAPARRPRRRMPRGCRGAADAAAGRRRRDALNPKYTFDQFVIGDANRFAHAAALAVAELPGQAYNPLFIYGPPGVGKTHLLHSIGNYVRAYGGGLSVRYTTVETFTNEFVAAVQRRLDRALQGPLPPQRRPAHRRRPVPRVQGQDRGGVLPHLQRALRGRQPARAHLRPPAARPRGARGPPARALRVRARRRRSRRPTCATRLTVLRKRVQHDGIAARRRAVLDAIAERVADERARARGRAHPRRRLRVAHRPRADRRPRRARSSTTSTRRARPAAGSGPAAPTIERIQDAHRRGLRHHARGAALPQPPSARSPGRARSPCTSRASTPARPCRRSPRASAGATTRPSCTPAGARPSAWPRDPEAYEAVRRLDRTPRRATGADRRD